MTAGCLGDEPPSVGEADTDVGSTGEGSTAGPSTSASTSSASTSSDSVADTGPESSTEASDASSTSEESSETGITPCTLSGEWEVVLDDEGPSGNGAQGRGIAGLADGNVYALGNADGHWFVRRSEDRGASWETIDDFTGASSGGVATPSGIAMAEDGTLFAVGLLGNGEMESHRVVRRSGDGMSWETVEDFQLETGYETFASAITIATDGTLYTSGHAASSQGGHWIIRRSDDDGDSWTTDDDYQRDAGLTCLPRDVFAAADGSVLASGHCFDVDDNSSWTVRRRTAEGWSTVDAQGGVGGNFPGYGAANLGFAGARLIVAGAVADDTSSHWVLRTSDDGTTWETLDDWISPAGGARATAVYDDGQGTLIAVGSESGTLPTIVTRRSDDDAISWETIDTYTYDAGIYGGPLERSADGDLFTSGIGLAVGGLNHWIVRRMACE